MTASSLALPADLMSTCSDAGGADCCAKIPLELPLGAELGRGTSGVVFPLLSSADGGRYVVKEVVWEEARRNDLLQEVRLHRLCSDGCAGVVRYAFSTITTSPLLTAGPCREAFAENQRLLVLMEACEGELWDVMIESEEPALSRLPSRISARKNSKSSGSRPPLPQKADVALPGVPWTQESASTAQFSSQSERRRWTLTLCDALRHCHGRRVLHRDLNPWNVLIVDEMDFATGHARRGVRLADFGLAAQFPEGVDEFLGMSNEGVITLDASAIGSFYSAPELGERYGLAADVFSLGMTLFALWWAPGSNDACPQKGSDLEDALVNAVEAVKSAVCAGSPPLDTICLPRFRSGGNSAFRSLIFRMLSFAPRDRPTAMEVYDLCATWHDQEEAGKAMLPDEPLSAKSTTVEAPQTPQEHSPMKVVAAGSLVTQSPKQATIASRCCRRSWLRMWSCPRISVHGVTSGDEVRTLSQRSPNEKSEESHGPAQAKASAPQNQDSVVLT